MKSIRMGMVIILYIFNLRGFTSSASDYWQLSELSLCVVQE
jgi:hypothetical protein